MLSVSTQLAVGESLEQCETLLKSISWADEILMYNFGRSDSAFTALCQKYRATIINLPDPLPPVVEHIRAREVLDSHHDWVLLLDYDEVVTASLAAEIKAILSRPSSPYSTYALPRRNFSLGYPLRRGGFGDDYVIRLFRRRDFLGWPKDIHSTPTYLGNLGKLTHYLEHHKDASLSQMIQKTNRYTEVEAAQFLAGGAPRVSSLTLLRKTVMEFIRRYFLKLGILDGRIGLLQALYQSYSIFLRYAKLSELQQKKGEI